MTPTPKPPSPQPDFDLLTRFRPEFDPILTPNRQKRSKLGQIQVRIGSEGGSKSGQGEGEGLGVGSSGWSGSVAPSNSKICNPRIKRCASSDGVWFCE